MKSKFGGGKKGHSGMVSKPRICNALDGVIPWKVPKSRGLVPIRPPNVTDKEGQARLNRKYSRAKHENENKVTPGNERRDRLRTPTRNEGAAGDTTVVNTTTKH